MTRHARIVAVLFPLLTFLAVPCAAQGTDPGQSKIYRLLRTTTYQHGCFPPCACPIVESSNVRGTFRLARTGADPLYEYYAVTDVNWVVTVGTTGASNLRVTGSGTYKVGGEFAIQHQLILDLVVDDRPVEHYDSGLVAGGGNFPAIDIEISVHGRYCLDTVFEIHAKPLMRIGVASHGVSWDPISGDTGYDIVRGDLQALRQTRGNFAAATTLCVANDVTSTSVPSGASPAAGQAFWFLGREIQGSSVDTYDSGDAGQTGSCDAGISASPASCP